jgi:AraC family transcriptional regulator, exoenzyme S synthesis regulatory protein ExsA
MLHRFPPTPHEADNTFIKGVNETFGKLKIEPKAGKREVFITQHTLIYVIRGRKILHFPKQSVDVHPRHVFLLPKGIYVMAENMEEGETFEAVMLFLSDAILRSFLEPRFITNPADTASVAYSMFSASLAVQDFFHQFRRYFDYPTLNFDEIVPLKQREILLLLMNEFRNDVIHFILDAVSVKPESFDYIIRKYILGPVSLSKLADITNRSLATFKRDFQKFYGMPPKRWINLTTPESCKNVLVEERQVCE